MGDSPSFLFDLSDYETMRAMAFYAVHADCPEIMLTRSDDGLVVTMTCNRCAFQKIIRYQKGGESTNV